MWNCIECTRIQSDRKATPAQVRTEVWMSLIHGSQGLVYFVHEWKPKFDEHALLDDPEMLAAVTAINKQIQVAGAGPEFADGGRRGQVASSEAKVPVQAMVKRHGGATYIFAVAMRRRRHSGDVYRGGARRNQGRGPGQGRTLKVTGGKFEDAFEPYAVHLYRLQ